MLRLCALFLFFSPVQSQEAKTVELRPKDSHSIAVSGWLDGRLEGLVKVYKHFHSHPELSFQELKTATMIGKELEKCGFEVTTGVAEPVSSRY